MLSKNVIETLQSMAQTPTGRAIRTEESVFIQKFGREVFVQLLAADVLFNGGRVPVNAWTTSVNNWKYETAYYIRTSALESL